MANDEQFTPKWLFDRMGIEFDLDVSAPIGGAPNVPARKWYTIEDNGLIQDWFGLVWMNPPYSKPSPWVDKFIAHNNGIALLPMSKSKWTKKIWEAADGIKYVGVMKFEQINGEYTQIYMPVLLYAMGENARNILLKTNLGRVR